MPYARANGLQLYYELHGQGTPLCLIEGIGYATWMWLRQLEALAGRHQVLIYDNRDVGRSDLAEQPYTIADMAADLAGLLDALGMGRVHVVGVSMGGFIAQEFALAYGERVRGLVLVGTHFGGAEAVPVPAEALQRMYPDQEMPPQERLRWAMAYAFAPGYAESHPELVDGLIRARLALPQVAEAWLRQANASRDFDTSARLGGLAGRTLVVHGEQDQVVPVANAQLLAERLPRAELAILPGGGHLVFIEQAERFNALVLDFLARVEADEG